MSDWKRRFDAGMYGLPYKNLVCGWDDDEYDDLSHDAYLEVCRKAVDANIDGTPYGVDVQLNCTLPTFKGWRDKERASEEERGDLGFSWDDCDLCGALPGNRYAVTALPDNPATNPDYVALKVCQDCLMYVTNNEEPCE